MNLSVTKDNINLFEVNLGEEVFDNSAHLSFFIGREKSCKVVLDDKRVSREHAKISFNNSVWSIEKCDGFSTLIVNGSPVEIKNLAQGDVIRINPYVITVSGNVSQASSDVVVPQAPEPSEVDVDHNEEESEEETDVLEEGIGPDLGLGDEATEFKTQDNTASFAAGFDEEEPETFEAVDDEYSEEYEEVDEYALEEVDNESTKVLDNFSNYYLEISGEYAPYDKYKIVDNEVYIGRDSNECHIVLNDPEVSGKHVKVTKRALNCTIEDLKSANGTLLNGERVNLNEIKNNDEFVIGSTTFTVKVVSSFLEEEKERMMPVAENQFVEVEEIVDVDEGDEDALILGGGLEEAGGGSDSLFTKEALKDPEKRKKILIIIVVLLGVWTLLDDGNSGKKPPKKVKKVAKKNDGPSSVKNPVKKLTTEEREIVDAHYILVTQFYNEGRFSEAIMEADKVYAITPEYKNLNQYVALAKEGVKKLEQLEKERRDKERERQRKIKIEALLKKAESAVDDKKMDLASGLLDEVISLDPNNDDVLRLRREIDLYKKEQDRIAVEKARKEAERKRQLSELSPGKTYFLKREWFKAISKLSDFLRNKTIDEDLRKEASDMLNKSKNNLKSKVAPLLGKARSLKEGQDLKGAYEVYHEILTIEPSHVEALNEMNEIRENLEIRSKKIYREAIISESLSLYDDAKAKFQEVQQVSPTDSEYYKKAVEKLKEYLD